MNSSYCAPRSNSITHKSLLEAWAAIKIPQHLILISLLWEAEGLGIPLQEHKNKRQLFTEEKKWETDEFTSAPISFGGTGVQQGRVVPAALPRCQQLRDAVVHLAWLSAAEPCPWVLLNNHGQHFGRNPEVPSHQGTPGWQETCRKLQWKMLRHLTAKS